jgi:hypothetical protein
VPYIGQQPAPKVITSSDLSADVVTEAKIADNAVENEHLNANVITGHTALGATPADTDELLVSDAGTLKRVDFSYLKGGGQKTLLATTTCSSSSSVAFNSLITSTYRDYHITFSNIHSSGDGAELRLYLSTDNGSSYATGNWHENIIGLKQDGDNVLVNTNSGRDYLGVTGTQGIGTAAGETASGFVTLYDLLGTDNHKGATGMSAGESSSGVGYIFSHGGSWRDLAAVTGVKLQMSSGNMVTGVVKFYGIT